MAIEKTMLAELKERRDAAILSAQRAARAYYRALLPGVKRIHAAGVLENLRTAKRTGVPE